MAGCVDGCGRWFGHGDDEKRLDVAELTLDAYKHYEEFWIYPLALYIVWQVAYLIKTEIMDAKGSGTTQNSSPPCDGFQWTRRMKNAWTLKQFQNGFLD